MKEIPINIIVHTPTYEEAERITGCDPSNIRKVCKGKLKKCGNFIWKEKN